MIASLRRTWLIAHNTLTEALRQRVLNLLLLFGLVSIGSANFFTSFTFDEQIKFVKDFSFGAISLFGTLLAILGAAQMLPGEIESRTVYTILSKPVRRAELLWGKFLGLAELLFIAVALMSVVFVVVLAVKEQNLIAGEQAQAAGETPEMLAQRMAEIHQQIRDPQMAQALLLITAKLLLTAGLAVLVSTVATSTIFTVSTTLLIYLIGHWQATARDYWLSDGTAGWAPKFFAGALAIFVPDFSAYGVVDDMLSGQKIPWPHTLELLAYSGLYLLVLMLVSQVVFNEREL